MGQSSRFPNLREFRARAERLGQITGDVDDAPVSARAPSPETSSPWMWIALAVAATVSLGWLGYGVMKPADDRAQVAEAPPSAPVVSGPAGRAAASAETRTLTARIQQLEDEVRTLRRDMAATAQSEAELRRRIDVIEGAFGPATGSLGPGNDSGRPLDPGGSGSSRASARAVPALPQVADLPSRDQSGAVSAATPGAGAERSRISSNFTFALDLGGFGNLVELKQYWSRIVGDNPLLLGGLVPRQVTQVQADGIRSYRLLAGPIATVDGAERLCRQIVLRGAECSQSINTGAPI